MGRFKGTKETIGRFKGTKENYRYLEYKSVFGRANIKDRADMRCTLADRFVAPLQRYMGD